MNYVTLDFVDRVLYFKSVSLGMKGAQHITPAIKELLEYRQILLGEMIAQSIADIEYLNERRERSANAIDKLALLAAMDVKEGRPPGEEAAQIIYDILRHG